MQFLRATQTNGRFDPHSDGRSLPLSPEAFAFWQEHGAVIANLLRPETPCPSRPSSRLTPNTNWNTPKAAWTWALTLALTKSTSPGRCSN